MESVAFPSVNSTHESSLDVVILHHSLARVSDLELTMVFYLAQAWQELGLRVGHHFGTCGCPKARLVFLHVDTTRVPARYLRAARKASTGGRVLNAAVDDIRKSVVSSLRVRRGDAVEGPVIGKSEWNFAGIPERRLRRRWLRSVLPDPRRWLKRSEQMWDGLWLPPVPEGDIEPYTVWPSMAEVPPDWWRRPGRVLERFVPERDAEGRYVLRMAYFLGGEQANFRITSTDAVVKGARTETFDPEPLPGEIVQVRERLGLDYGKIDYVRGPEGWVILDVNKTVGSYPAQAERHADFLRRFASGLTAYLD